MKYFAYCRKSSEGERKQAQSIETQQRIINEMVQRDTLTVKDWFVESKSAADDGQRAQFTSMMERFRNNEADGLVVAHIDRISRNLIESGFISKLFKLGILKEIRTPSKTYTEDDTMYLEMEFVWAAEYSRRLSKRVKEGVQTKLQKGEYPAWAPTGYLNKEGKIYPDPQRSLYVEMAYKLYSTGQYSLRDLNNYLYEKGLRSRGGKKLGKKVLHKMLTDPIYTGVIRRYGKIYKGIHAPIISQSSFDQVQKVLSGFNRSKKIKLDFLYRGYLSCAVCGCQFTATRKKSIYDYYYCTNGKNICTQHRRYLSEARVQTILQGIFDNFNLEEEMANLSFEAYAEDVRASAMTDNGARESIESQLTVVREKLSDLLDMILNKKITEERYDEKSKELENEEKILENQLKHLKPQNPEITLELVEEVKNKAVSLSEMFAVDDEQIRGDLLKSVLWNSTIKDGEIQSTRYKLPFAYLAELNKSSDFDVWRRGRDSNPR